MKVFSRNKNTLPENQALSSGLLPANELPGVRQLFPSQCNGDLGVSQIFSAAEENSQLLDVGLGSQLFNLMWLFCGQDAC